MAVAGLASGGRNLRVLSVNVQAESRYNGTMRSLLLSAALVALPLGALAQGTERRPPRFWLSLGSGYLMLQPVDDGGSSARWDFGDGWPMQVSLEKAVSPSATIGVAAMWIRAPLTYRSAASCGVCDAHATVAYYGPLFSMGRDGPFYQFLEVSAGVIQYGSFEHEDSGLRLPPADTNHDFAFALGTGLGWALRPDWQLELGASLINAVHERANLPGNTQTMRQHRMFRLALRVGY